MKKILSSFLLISILSLLSSFKQDIDDKGPLINNIPKEIISFINSINKGFPIKIGQNHIGILALKQQMGLLETDILTADFFKALADNAYSLESNKLITEKQFLDIFKRSSFTKWNDLNKELTILDYKFDKILNTEETIQGDLRIIIEKDKINSGFGIGFKNNGDTILGKFENGKPEGLCIIQKSNGDLIFVYLNNKYNDDNRGIIKYPNNKYFVGKFKKNQFEASEGTLKLGDNIFYKGQISNDLPNGRGELITLNKGKIERKSGKWENGIFDLEEEKRVAEEIRLEKIKQFEADEFAKNEKAETLKLEKRRIAEEKLKQKKDIEDFNKYLTIMALASKAKAKLENPYGISSSNRQSYSNNSKSSTGSKACYACKGSGNCPACSKTFRVPYWGGYGWKESNQSRPGQIICGKCRGAGVIWGQYQVGTSREPDSKKCPISSCNSGWVNCSECNAFGNGKNVGKCKICNGSGISK
jgi:hypothetical protein